MIQVKKVGIILEKTMLPFENEGVLNPAAIREGDFVHLFYRAVSEGNYSSIGYCKLMGPLEVEQRLNVALISPEFEYEKHGMEDPRIVKIEDLYYLTYTAYDGVNALGALATSSDLIHFEKKGIIVPQMTYEDFNRLAETNVMMDEKYYRFNQHNHIVEKEGLKMLLWDKNVIFFPRKINGKFCFFHRIRPEIQIVIQIDALEELTKEFWKNYFINFKEYVVLSSKYDHEKSYIGGGCPPIETEFGWLIIYHGVHDSITGYVYSACAALLELEDPKIEIARLSYPLFQPEEIWELKGEVNNVCFPTGAVVFDDTLYIYYGAADERIACASMSLSELLKELMLNKKSNFERTEIKLPEILFITTFPARECGIATYSQDLILALKNKFEKSFDIKIAALELHNEKYDYKEDIYAVLETDNPDSYLKLAERINTSSRIETVLIQHEFGLFAGNEADFISFLNSINKPKIVAFHTVLPRPDEKFKKQVQEINATVDAFIVMTHNSARILESDYQITKDKITVIPRGTHLVEHSNKEVLKEKYNLAGRKIISTFGLLSSGKGIETSINALQTIVKAQPDVLFLIIGKTHPTVFKNEGEKYRNTLKASIEELGLQGNVKFVDEYLPLDSLLEYLQLTDVYLFTSKDRNQAVSGTFSYAISCGCPIVSTPIPHAVEVLGNGTGIIIDFENPKQLAQQVIHLLNNEQLRKNISANGIHKLAPTAWENSAIAHAFLFEKMGNQRITLQYKIPKINLNHFKNLTTPFGMIQFSKINQPDLDSGYTLDDNSRALVAMCQHFELTNDEADLAYIQLHFNFIKFCLQSEGYFLNYVDESKKFTKQNSENLADANGRAIWALGYLISIGDLLPSDLNEKALLTMQKALINVNKIHSTRAMAFIIKGIYYSNLRNNTIDNVTLIQHFANKLVQMYKHEAKENWQWFESYLTYANSILPEAMLCAYLATGDIGYKEIAKKSFDFLLSKIYRNNRIRVISNQGWLTNGEELNHGKVGGEQPIDVAYTILALSKFYDVFREEKYLHKMEIGFSWFLGNNHLNQIIYNPCTGGYYDGLEDSYINLNQGTESTVSYLMARLTMEKKLKQQNKKILVANKKALKPMSVLKAVIINLPPIGL